MAAQAQDIQVEKAMGAGLGIGAIGWMAGIATGPVGCSLLFLVGSGTYLTTKVLQQGEKKADGIADDVKKWSNTGKALAVSTVGFFTAAGAAFLPEDGTGAKTAMIATGTGACIAGLSTATAIQCTQRPQ